MSVNACFIIAADSAKRRQHGSVRSVGSDCTFSQMSPASLTSEDCHYCQHCHTSDKDVYTNGEVTTDMTTRPSDGGPHSCSCQRNRLNCQQSEREKSYTLCRSKSPDAAESPVESETHRHCDGDSLTDRHHSTSEVQCRSLKLANGTDESCSVTDERSDGGTVLERDGEPRSDDAVSETVKPCQSSVDMSCVTESARQNILDAAETFASIIGREIAASFDLKEGELSPPECQGASAGGSSASTGRHGNATRTLPAGCKLLADDRRRESERDKGPPLDTVEVARRVRQILTTNNIGQRQFARYVLGLSQGTVSELLAKPKPWDRLTEKGKESYRRMNQWANDHMGVLSLKDHLNSVALKANLPSAKGCYYCIFLRLCNYLCN